jgi:hypothetical protein
VVSRQIHNRYKRRLADTANSGQEVLIYLQVRQVFFRNDTFAKTTFTGQVPGLTVHNGRQTCGLDALLQAVAMTLSGRPGAPLTSRLTSAVSLPR